jgi:hypothetical protein
VFIAAAVRTETKTKTEAEAEAETEALPSRWGGVTCLALGIFVIVTS